MNDLGEDENCLVENEVIAINGKLKSIPFSSNIGRNNIKSEDSQSLGLHSTGHYNHNNHRQLVADYNSNNNNNHLHNNNGKLNVQYISVSYHSTSGLTGSTVSPFTSGNPVSPLSPLSSSSPPASITPPTSSSSSSSLSYKSDNTLLHQSAIKLEPNDNDKRVFNPTITNSGSESLTTASIISSPLTAIKLESCDIDKSNHHQRCFISFPSVVDDLEIFSPTSKSHSLNPAHHHHHHSQRVLISPTDFLTLTEEATASSAVKKDVNLSASRLEIIKKSNDIHGLTVSLDRYCESPFLIESHREIHLISDDDASNTGRASRLSESHEDMPPDDLFAATLADQHNSIREVVITPIESDNSQATPTIISATSIKDRTSNGFDLRLVKEEKFDQDDHGEQMIVEEEAIEQEPDDVIDRESRQINTATVTTFSVLNTLHNNSSVRLTPEESSSSLELRPSPLSEQITRPTTISPPIIISTASAPVATPSATITTLSGISSQQQQLLTPHPTQITLPSTSSLSFSSVVTTPSTLSKSIPTLTSSSGPGSAAVISSSSISNLATSPVNNSNSSSNLSASNSSNTSNISSQNGSSSNSSQVNVTLPLTPLDIKILPGGLLQFAANVAAVFPSSTILQKQLALQLLREDGTSIILPLATRSGDSGTATSHNNSNNSSSNNNNSSAISAFLSQGNNNTNNATNGNKNNVNNIGVVASGTVVSGISISSSSPPSSSSFSSSANHSSSLINERREQFITTTTAATATTAVAAVTTAAATTATTTATLTAISATATSTATAATLTATSTTLTANKEPTNSCKLIITDNNNNSTNNSNNNNNSSNGSSPEVDRPFKCELCNSTFTRLGNYTRHKKIHSLPSKEDQRFRCDICGKSFIQRCDLARHLHIHRGTEPHRCSQCGKGYIRHSDLVTHQRFHNKEKPFACPHCSKGFCQRGDLNRHLRSIHLQLKPILCSHCHKKFAKEETLLRHINANHRDTVVT